MDEIPIGALSNGIGVVGVVLIVFYLLAVRQTLHTDAEFKRMVADHKRELEDIAHDRDEWRTESRIKDQQLDEQGIQIRAMAEGLRTVEAVMHAIHDLARSGGSKETTP